VDDSILFRQTLMKMLNESSVIEVVGEAADPYEARDKIKLLKPDVMTLDVEMPKMNGIAFLKELIPQNPLPTVVVSSAPIAAFDALDAGAVDYIKKPAIKTHADLLAFANEMKLKVQTAASAKVRRPYDVKKSAETFAPVRYAAPVGLTGRKVIAIGTSTGGTDALQTVFKTFPVNSPPVVVVQHMPPVFTKMFAERLNRQCDITVKEAQHGDRLETGVALIAPGDFQMELKKDVKGFFVSVKKGEKVSGHCPSVDVLFNSVAETAGKDAIGVIMTGMGADGAKGLLNMRTKGAYTIGQDKETCVVYGMPMVAFDTGACCMQSPLGKITDAVFKRLTNR
jgi:two-component system chemotaxis response regulator CheB